MHRGSSAVAVLRMTSWPVLIILIAALMLALAGYWLSADAQAREPVAPALVAESAPAQADSVVLR
jgi:hypothetical protein